MLTKKVLGLLIIVLSLVIIVGASLVSATELITNPGMETGNTSGWSVNGRRHDCRLHRSKTWRYL